LDNYIKDINRLKALLAYSVIDTPPEEFYNTLNSLVSKICNTPISLITFIDDRRQWYKAKTGIDINEIAIEETICQYSMYEDDIMEIQDTLEDERLVNNASVQAENGIRFYASMPLRTESGYTIGSVCAADFKPQRLSEVQKQTMRDVAKMVMIHLETKKRNEDMENELKDILTEKIRSSERQIQIQERVYNNLFEAISQSNAIIEFSIDGTILNLNERFAEMMGYSVQELIGQKHTILLTESLNENNDFVWEKLVAGQPYSGKFRRRQKDGKTIWIQASYSPVIDLKGEVTKITNISIDITNDILAINSLEALSNQKDNFIANISHELRSPIHAILGFTELLIEEEANGQKKKQLQSVKTAGDTLLYLVNGILDLSKIEAGLFQFDLRDFNLHDTIENVFSILNGKARHKKLSFSYEVSPDVPAILTGDPHRLEQVLINLLDNALKFTSEGEVTLQVSAKKKNPGSAELTFVVSDTGIGIPEEKLESVFGRFTQAEENTTRKYGGTGLGLNICKLLVEKQGGTIFVNSKFGEYTRFTFQLTYDIPENQEQQEAVTSTKDYSSLSGKILMCEDNEANRILAQHLFAATNVELDLAENGKIGVEMLRQKKYDVVLMDIQMPEMDGYQATACIREELKSETPIVALTAHSIANEREKCIAAGMNDYLSKPFKKSELFDLIGQWLKTDEASSIKEDFAFSLEIINEASMGNTAFEHQMLNLFLEQSSESMEKLKQMYIRQDWDAISKQAHQLKSSFGMFLMDTSLLDKIEKRIDHSELDNQLEKLEKQILRANKHIQQLITQNT
jgi:PAS domain S-box-containing protein